MNTTHGIQKTIIGGRLSATDFRATRQGNTAPEIHEEYTGDDGEQHYILSSGNSIPKDRYDSVWKPLKGEIKPKNYKGVNPDGTKNWQL